MSPRPPDPLADAIWTAYESRRAAAWGAYLEFRGPPHAHGSDARTWEEFAARSARGLAVYRPVQQKLWREYLDALKGAGIL